MARPINNGLDYFPLDTDIDQDDKVALVESDYGLVGFGIIIKLLMKIYANGYFYEWTEKEQKLFVRRVNVDINTLSAVVNACIRWGVFNKQLFEKFNVLSSRGIQKRYLEATTRRKSVEIIEELTLLSKEEISKYSNVVIVNINSSSADINVDINPNSSDQMLTETTQSKVKESRVKESKAEESINASADDNIYQIYEQNFGMINPLTMQNLDMWQVDIGSDLVVEAMKRAATDQKGYRYAEGIMRNWVKKGIKTLDDVKAEDVAFDNRKQQRFSNNRNKEEPLPEWAKDDYQVEKDEEVSDEELEVFQERIKSLREKQGSAEK